MSGFTDRLQQAAARAGYGDSQADLARALDLSRQRINRWFVEDGAGPDADVLLDISSRLGVNPKWLKTGEGAMIPDAANEDLSSEERALIRDYRSSSQKTREAIRAVVRTMRKVATVVVAAIPPLLASPDSEATLHNRISGHVPFANSMNVIHIVRQWARILVRLLTPSIRLSAA